MLLLYNNLQKKKLYKTFALNIDSIKIALWHEIPVKESLLKDHTDKIELIIEIEKNIYKNDFR